MTESKKVPRRLILTAASVLPLSACVGTLEDGSTPEGVRVQGLTSEATVTNVSKFRLDLIAGSGEDPASNWYSVEGGSITSDTKSGGDVDKLLRTTILTAENCLLQFQ